MKPIEVRLALRFKIQSKIEGGHQSLLYKATHMQTNQKIVLKGQQVKTSKNKKAGLGVLQQGKIYQTMQGGIGIPYMHWCGQEQDYNFLVLEEMDTTLSKLLTRCGGAFSLKTALMLGMELTQILQYFHFKSYVYSNINTKHVMLGSGQNYGKIYIIDMNKASKFKDSVMHEHIPEPSEKGWEMRFANMEFSSLSYQRGLPTTRKDDMQSLMYLLSYVLNGSLPWSHQIWNMKKTQFQKCRYVAETKSASGDKLFKGYPELQNLYNYTVGLKFDEKPQYAFYVSTFTRLLEKNGQIDDKMYDWFFLQDEGPLDLNHRFDLFEGEEQLIERISHQLSEKKDQNTNVSVRTNAKIPSGKYTLKGKGQKQCQIY